LEAEFERVAAKQQQEQQEQQAPGEAMAVIAPAIAAGKENPCHAFAPPPPVTQTCQQQPAPVAPLQPQRRPSRLSAPRYSMSPAPQRQPSSSALGASHARGSENAAGANSQQRPSAGGLKVSSSSQQKLSATAAAADRKQRLAEWRAQRTARK